MTHSRPPAETPRPSSALSIEQIRGERPTEESWRADALAKSRHSRLADHLLQPVEDHDVGRSEAVCAAVTREFLRDYAPALILLPVAQRRRAQALTAYALVLFDFAKQSGLEGERLAQIPGMTPNMLALPPGCAFGARCPRQAAACQTAPAITGLIEGHPIRCFHPHGTEVPA